VQPISPFEIKAGTVIPSVMIGGINSTLPGQLIAQVTQNVYDTASGHVLLIPQGTRIVGSYEHQIASGQKRVFVVWNRLIYPDASSVNLEGMNGVDASGYGGFSDQSDMHFWPTFRNALLLSTISAAVQLSQPTASNGNAYSSNQVAAGALGQQMNQVGMNSIGKTQNQAPTLTIRAGYIFNVMVNKDIILQPWNQQGGLS
jgi:type IV secretory pathway VirB10-like protein